MLRFIHFCLTPISPWSDCLYISCGKIVGLQNISKNEKKIISHFFAFFFVWFIPRELFSAVIEASERLRSPVRWSENSIHSEMCVSFLINTSFFVISRLWNVRLKLLIKLSKICTFNFWHLHQNVPLNVSKPWKKTHQQIASFKLKFLHFWCPPCYLHCLFILTEIRFMIFISELLSLWPVFVYDSCSRIFFVWKIVGKLICYEAIFKWPMFFCFLLFVTQNWLCYLCQFTDEMDLRQNVIVTWPGHNLTSLNSH